MRHTQSPDTIVHPGTGNRMHTDTAPIPSAVTADDLNMILWELNAIRQAAAIAGVAFDPNTAATYTQVLASLRKLFMGRGVGDWLRDSDELERFNFQAGGTTSYKGHGATAHSFLNEDGLAIARMLDGGNMTLPNRDLAPNDNSDFVPDTAWVQAFFSSAFAASFGTFRASEIGKISYVPAMQANADHVPLSGIEINRVGGYADLYAYAVASGMLVTDAVWASRPGCFSYGPGGVGGTTFRTPKVSGLVVKSYHNGDGTYTTNTSLLNGQYAGDELKYHNHETQTGSSEGDSGNTYTNGNGPNAANVPTTYVGGNENTVRSVILFAQMRYR